jgi:chaperonin GroES
MKIKPIGDRYLVEPVKEEKKKGGIILPDTLSKEKPEEGIIIAVGTGKPNHDGSKMIPLELKKGAKVLFTKYAPHEVKVGEKEYLVIKEEDILAVIE